MRNIRETTKFRRDLKTVRKRGKDVFKLLDIVDKLAKDIALEVKHHPHPLTGDWKPCWECHIEPDWLLVYIIYDDYVELIRTGSHSDLF